MRLTIVGNHALSSLINFALRSAVTFLFSYDD